MDGTRDASSQKEHTSKWRISASIITEGSEEYAEGDLARLMLGHSPMTFPSSRREVLPSNAQTRNLSNCFSGAL